MTSLAQPITAEQLVQVARQSFERIDPQGAFVQHQRGALLIDIRTAHERELDGEIPNSIAIDRNVLEWRVDPTSVHRHPAVTGYDQTIVIISHDGDASTLAVLQLLSLGLTSVTDVIGGYQSWAACGLPVIAGSAPITKRSSAA